MIGVEDRQGSQADRVELRANVIMFKDKLRGVQRMKSLADADHAAFGHDDIGERGSVAPRHGVDDRTDRVAV